MWQTNLSAGGGNTGGGIKAGAAISAGTAAIGGTGPGGWHPDVLFMLALVIGEVLVAGFLSRHLLG